MLTLLFLASHSSRIMELLVMMVVAVIIFQEIFACADRQKLSSTRMSEKAVDAQGKKSKGKEGDAQGKKSKSKEKEKKSKESEGTQPQTAQTAMAESQQPSATQISFHGKAQEAKKPEEKKGKAEPAAEVVQPKVRKYDKPLLSDPIVTPVTDEFPTDDQENEKEEAKDKGQQTGQTGKRFKPGAKDLSVDYGAKKHKTGAERCVSNPIVTPVTDEFATEDEAAEVKDNAKKTDGKKENGKEEKEKEKKKSNGKKG